MATRNASLTVDEMVTELIHSIINGVSQLGHTVKWRHINGDLMDTEQNTTLISSQKVMNIICDIGFETMLYYIYLDRVVEYLYHYLADMHGDNSTNVVLHRIDSDCPLHEFNEATMIHVYDQSAGIFTSARTCQWKQDHPRQGSAQESESTSKSQNK